MDIFDAIEQGDLTALRKIVLSNKGVASRQRSDGWYPIHMAALKGNQQAAEMLIQMGADLNVQVKRGCYCDATWTPLEIAIVENQFEFAEYIIRKGAKAAFLLKELQCLLKKCPLLKDTL